MRLLTSLLCGFTGTLDSVDIGSSKQLLVDDYTLDSKHVHNVSFRVNRATPPHTWISVLQPDREWERGAGCYMQASVVLRDARTHKFRMWYSIAGCTDVNSTEWGKEWRVAAYAESDDGITFAKPALGLVPFRNTSRATNLVALELDDGRLLPCSFCDMVFTDPTAAPAQRFKACGKIASADVYGVPGDAWLPYSCAASADGLTWRYLTTLKIGDVDSDGNFVLIEGANHTVQWSLYHRLWLRYGSHLDTRNFRTVRRLIGPSVDVSDRSGAAFALHADDWTPQNATYRGDWAAGEGNGTCLEGFCDQAVVMTPDAQDNQGVFAGVPTAQHYPPPVDYYGGTIWRIDARLMLMFPIRMWHYGHVATLNNTVQGAVPCNVTLPHHHHTCDPATKEPGLAVSRDEGGSFQYVERAASVLGVGLRGSKASYTTWILPTPIQLADRIHIYFRATNEDENSRVDPEAARGTGTEEASFGTFLATARLDGLASLTTSGGYGTVATAMTKPLRVAANSSALQLNFDTQGIGSMAVELCDADGEPLPGFGAAEAVPLSGANALSARPQWAGMPGARGVAGALELARQRGGEHSVVRVRFHFVAPCQLFSFQFV